MQLIKLKISDNIFDKFMWLLKKFGPDEIQIIHEKSNFEKDKEYLTSELNDMDSGNAKFYSINEAEIILDKAINNK